MSLSSFLACVEMWVFLFFFFISEFFLEVAKTFCKKSYCLNVNLPSLVVVSVVIRVNVITKE